MSAGAARVESTFRTGNVQNPDKMRGMDTYLATVSDTTSAPADFITFDAESDIDAREHANRIAHQSGYVVEGLYVAVDSGSRTAHD